MSRQKRKIQDKALKLAQRAEQLMTEGKGDAAIGQYEKAYNLMPEYADLLNNFANLLTSQNRLDKALKLYRQALKLDPDSAVTYANLANALGCKGEINQALEACKKVLELDPEFTGIHALIGKWLSKQGQCDEAIAALEQARQRQPGESWIKTLYLLTLNYTVDDPEQILKAHQQAGSKLGARRLTNDTIEADLNRPLRIGYVSGDFCRHSVAFFIEPILKHHNRTAFISYCYSNNVQDDPVTERLQGVCDNWRPIRGLSDIEASKLIKSDQIDILVDLAGHTQDNRLKLFQLRPAPIQITYLGYPATTGMGCIDYRITDITSDPVGESDRFYTEKLLRLERGFLTYAPPTDQQPANISDVLSGDRPITFGSFNNLAKLSSATLVNWSEILKQVPDSRLILKSHGFHDDGTVELTLARFATHGINPSQLDLRPTTVGLKDHLAMYAEIDIALDTFPYNGTTTTCEALWMGVPVLTLTGETHKSRVGASILGQIGATDLITHSPRQFVERAAELANTPNQLQTYQNRLHDQVVNSPLMDAQSFTSDLEGMFRKVWCGLHKDD